MKTLLLTALLALSGCATLERHPVLASIGGALIVGSIAASLDHHGGDNNPVVQINPVARPVRP